MNTQHTPNWFIDQYGHVYAMRPPVDGVSTSECLVDSRYSKATAQEKLLIAAAPDLLEALRVLLENFAPIFDNDNQANVDAYYEAKRVIAKANGGQ